MKLFCVVDVNDEYGHEDLIGVFSSRELADNYITNLVNRKDSYWKRMVGEPQHFGGYNYNDGLTIIETDLDSPD